MRILVATDQWFPDFRGGSARVARDTASLLAKRGHDLTVLAPRHPGEPDTWSQGSLEVRRMLPRGIVPQTFSDPVQVRRALRYLRGPFDVLLAHQPTNAAGLLSARTGAPIVLVFHASVPRELRFRSSKLPIGREGLTAAVMARPLALFERSAVRRAHSILVLSEFSRSILEADHPRVAERIRLVGGGVDVRAFAPEDGPRAAREVLGLDPGETILLTVRRLEPRMGIEPLLHAIRLLLDSRKLRLAIAGSGMLKSRLEALTAELGLGEQVDFLGRLPEERLRLWYRAADLFVLPTVAYEGFGMATVEALASGTPVVGTHVGATPELLEPFEPRLIAPSASAADLAGAITSALELTGASLRARCREYAVSRFDSSSTISTWEDALLDAVHSRGRPG